MKSKQYLKRLALVVVVLAALYLGVGLIAQADGPFMEVRLLRVLINAVVDGDLSVGDDLSVTDGVTAASVTATGTVGAADVTASDDLVVGDDAHVAGDLLAGTGAFTTSLTLESVAFSGPLTFGRQQTVTHGITIAHGLGTTPTVILLTPSGTVTGAVGYSAADATSFTVSMDPALTFDYLDWIAGK